MMIVLLFVKQLSTNSKKSTTNQVGITAVYINNDETVSTTFASLYLECPCHSKKPQKNSLNPRQGIFPEFFLGIPYINCCFLTQSIKYIYYTYRCMSFDHFLCLLCNHIKAIMLHDLELNKSFTSNLKTGSLYKSYARKI